MTFVPAREDVESFIFSACMHLREVIMSLKCTDSLIVWYVEKTNVKLLLSILSIGFAFIVH